MGDERFFESISKENLDVARELVQGAYDLHVHTNPSHFNRCRDDFQMMREAGEAGMAGVMIKNHYEPTASRAILANQYSNSSCRAYGGIVLNHPAGGLNPYAAESALKMGASIVWMPTRDAENCLRHGHMEGDFFEREGITILDADGRLKEEVYAIMETVKKYDACLATGHLSAEESTALCREGVRRKVRMILTHPEWYRTVVPLEIQQELAGEGVYIEKNWYNVIDGSVTKEELAEHIRALPQGVVYLATDRGQGGSGRPVPEFICAIACMLDCGVKKCDLRAAICRTPAEILSGNRSLDYPGFQQTVR